MSLSCDQAVRLGLDKFVARYTRQRHDDSTAGNIAACDQYYRCRRSVNDTQVRALSPTRRNQVTQIRRSLDALAEAGYAYTYISAGGGTMWNQIAAGDHAAREDILATLIADLRRPATASPNARRQANAALRTARRSLTSLRSPHASAPEVTGRESLAEYRSRIYPAARAAFARLQNLIASLPDAPARRVAREVQFELDAPTRNLHQNR